MGNFDSESASLPSTGESSEVLTEESRQILIREAQAADGLIKDSLKLIIEKKASLNLSDIDKLIIDHLQSIIEQNPLTDLSGLAPPFIAQLKSILEGVKPEQMRESSMGHELENLTASELGELSEKRSTSWFRGGEEVSAPHSRSASPPQINAATIAAASLVLMSNNNSFSGVVSPEQVGATGLLLMSRSGLENEKVEPSKKLKGEASEIQSEATLPDKNNEQQMQNRRSARLAAQQYQSVSTGGTEPPHGAGMSSTGRKGRR